MTLHLLPYKYSEYACFLAFFGLFVSLVQVFEVSIDWCGVFRDSSWRRCVFLFSCLRRNRCRLRAAAAGLFLFLFCNAADRSTTSSSSFSSKGLHIGIKGAEAFGKGAESPLPNHSQEWESWSYIPNSPRPSTPPFSLNMVEGAPPCQPPSQAHSNPESCSHPLGPGVHPWTHILKVTYPAQRNVFWTWDHILITNYSWLGSMDFKISSFMVSHGFGSCLIACLCFSEWLESHNSGDIVILNREQVGNPQIRHNDCQITIPKFHQKANGILCKVQSILFSQV